MVSLILDDYRIFLGLARNSWRHYSDCIALWLQLTCALVIHLVRPS